MSEKPEPPIAHTGKWIAIYPNGTQEGVITSGRPIAVGDALPNGTVLDKWDYGETEDGEWVVVGVLRDPRSHRIHFTDGSSKRFGDLALDDADALASGERSLVGQLASYPGTFEMMAGEMRTFGHTAVHEMSPLSRPTYAAMLGLEKAPEELGHFEQGWGAIHGLQHPEDERGT
jgi:hypothetical protein